ncbi:MAG: anhydro-N-acetylmuramic acid kinase [Rhodocyclaceae bacterium]|nr:anhydro-N-acetylmuramic acid kinase [Rhodocyclaceae bacterium]
MARWFAGLMSGTSLDGVDAVLVELEDLCDEPAGAPRPEIGPHAAEESVAVFALHHAHAPFPPELRAELLALQQAGGTDELARSALAAAGLARHCAEVLNPLLAANGLTLPEVGAIGAHGQTVRHRPDAGYTIQLLDGALLAELTGLPVVCDFRSADVAAGGQGAPLVPAFHAAVLGTTVPRVVLNLGGMANLTLLDPQRPVTGFDCGPGNVLLDAWVGHCRKQAFDADGAWAASGRVLPELLDRLLAHPFLARTPPKSCGREAFDLHWLLDLALEGLEAVDVQATLAEFTARSVADAISKHAPETRAVLVCGGGARNADLFARLRAAMPGRTVDVTSAIGLDPMHVEAAAFAWLARQGLAGLPGNLPAVTGARGPRVLGALYPAP